MGYLSLLKDYIKIADIHAHRLNEAELAALSMQSLLTPSGLSQLTAQQVAFLDMLSLRFSQLQDLMRSKIFTITLDALDEQAITFTDKLNKLENISYIRAPYNANWWMNLRKIRNQLREDYADDYSLIATHLSILIVKVGELLQFWKNFKKKLSPLLTNS